MSAVRSGGPALIPHAPAPAALAPAPAPPGAAFAAVLSAPGLPPFVVWSQRPLEEAAADALNDAAKVLRAAKVGPAPDEAQSADRRSPQAKRSHSTAYHAKASL